MILKQIIGFAPLDGDILVSDSDTLLMQVRPPSLSNDIQNANLLTYMFRLQTWRFMSAFYDHARQHYRNDKQQHNLYCEGFP